MMTEILAAPQVQHHTLLKAFEWNFTAGINQVQQPVVCDYLQLREHREQLFACISDTPNLKWYLLCPDEPLVIADVPKAWQQIEWPSNVRIVVSRDRVKIDCKELS